MLKVEISSPGAPHASMGGKGGVQRWTELSSEEMSSSPSSATGAKEYWPLAGAWGGSLWGAGKRALCEIWVSRYFPVRVQTLRQWDCLDSHAEGHTVTDIYPTRVLLKSKAAKDVLFACSAPSLLLAMVQRQTATNISGLTKTAVFEYNFCSVHPKSTPSPRPGRLLQRSPLFPVTYS